MINEDISEWHGCNTQVFWGEIAPCDHLVQIYESEEAVLNSIEGFLFSGIESGDSVVIIATPAHLESLEDRLKVHGFDFDYLLTTNQYIPLDAEETLAMFMVNGWPNEALFLRLVKDIVTRARGKDSRKVRAYGEMVALLWAQGHNGATVNLEHLWNKFCETEAFCLFCAYPKIGFTQDATESVRNICSTHTKVISGELRPKTEIFYKDSA